jgi:hypothetical protein
MRPNYLKKGGTRSCPGKVPTECKLWTFLRFVAIDASARAA